MSYLHGRGEREYAEYLRRNYQSQALLDRVAGCSDRYTSGDSLRSTTRQFVERFHPGYYVESGQPVPVGDLSKQWTMPVGHVSKTPHELKRDWGNSPYLFGDRAPLLWESKEVAGGLPYGWHLEGVGAATPMGRLLRVTRPTLDGP